MAHSKKHVQLVLSKLKKIYTSNKPELDYSNNLQLLVAVILSAQCTDKRVNMVTPALFKKYNSALDFANANLAELESIIHSTGFYKNKAKNIIGCCRGIVTNFNGNIPQTMAELTSLPGVGRKTANVILTHAFGINEGICVDTHVMRLSQRLGFTKNKDPIKIERDLMQITPKKEWAWITQTLILHGRRICTARGPKCEVCPISQHCQLYSSEKKNLSC